MLSGVAPHLTTVYLVPFLVEGAVGPVPEMDLQTVFLSRIEPDVHVRVFGVLVHEHRGPRLGKTFLNPLLRSRERLLRRDLLFVRHDRAVVRARRSRAASVTSDFDLRAVRCPARQFAPHPVVAVGFFHLRRHVL